MPPTNQSQQILYKYLSFDVAHNVLTTRSLRWSSPSCFNDPHDMQFSFQSQIDHDQVKLIALNQMWETYRDGKLIRSGNQLHQMLLLQRALQPGLERDEFVAQMEEPLEQGLSSHGRILSELSDTLRAFVCNFKILCLSDKKTSNRMWAHYGDSHGGVVLGFKSIAELDSPYVMARPMVYSSGVPDILDSQGLADILSGRESLETETILNKYIYTKSDDWEYEQEWRICSGDGRNPKLPYEDIPFHPSELAEVVLGLNMTTADRDRIVAKVSDLYPDADILVASRASTDFGIEINPVNEK